MPFLLPSLQRQSTEGTLLSRVTRVVSLFFYFRCHAVDVYVCVHTELDVGPLRSLPSARSRKEHMSEEEEKLLSDNQSLALQVRTRNHSTVFRLPQCQPTVKYM